MASLVLTRAIAAPRDEATSDEGVQLSTGIVVPGGMRFSWRCRYASLQTGAVAVPANTLPEGPYLRVYPAFNKLSNAPPTGWPLPPTFNEAPSKWSDRHIAGNRNQAGLAISGFSGSPGTDGDIASLLKGGDDPYYEVDANAQGSLWLPFVSSVKFAVGFSGTWVYDYFWAADDAPVAGAQRCYQTRNVAIGAAARTIPVPYSCTRFRAVGGLGSTPTLVLDDNAATAANSGSISVGSADYFPVGNSRALKITAGAVPTFLTFEIQVP